MKRFLIILIMTNFEENIIIGIFVRVVSGIILRILDFIIENKGAIKQFIFRLKKKSREDNNDRSFYNPNTPFTFNENHDFVGH